MAFALKYPDLLSSLIVVDIAPRNYPVHHDRILEGLKAIQPSELTSRIDADDALAKYVPEPDVRQFLLKNLQRDANNQFSWKLNVKALDENIELIGQGEPYKGTFEKETLFVRGIKSHYIEDGDRARIKQLFPHSTLVTMETGHWVQAEKPEEFVSVVKTFLHEKVNL
ncbi:MAG: hypothetical protein HC859_14060 [Bacteroidia bacterium]|nr:hypothetical protein [Bacteroidia bacterium]